MIKKGLRTFMMLAVIVFGFLLVNAELLANSMDSLDYSIELQEDGSGIVTETRRMNISEGTEVYLVFDKLFDSELTDIQVSDFGEAFTFQENWDIDASREAKAGKFGLIATDQGYELSWGVGEYGDHEFVVNYTISGMVRELEDGQSLNWRFFEGRNNVVPEDVSITISGPTPFTEEQTRMWAFGFDGEIYLKNGRLEGWSNQPFTERNHLTVLMQFLDEPFQPLLTLDQTLLEQEEEAKQNSSYQGEEDSDSDSTGVIVAIVIATLGGLAAIIGGLYTSSKKKAIKAADPLVTGYSREQNNQGKLYRDIPYPGGKMTDVAYLLQEQGKGEMEAYFNAYLLKWMKDGYLTQIKSKAQDEAILKLKVKQLPAEAGALENQFWQVLTLAADRHGEIDESQLTRSTEENYDRITEIKADLPYESKQALFDQGYLIKEDVWFWGNFKAEVIKSSFKGEELYDRLIQFENYLQDLLLLDKQDLKRQHLSEELLIWASLYNLVDPIIDHLEEVDPNYFAENRFGYADFYFISLYSRGFTSGYESAVTSQLMSSGGGGMTSIGGGGGSFGGGGGGIR